MASNKKANFDSKHTTVSVTQIKIVIYVIFDTPFHSPIPDRDSSPGLIADKLSVVKKRFGHSCTLNHGLKLTPHTGVTGQRIIK